MNPRDCRNRAASRDSGAMGIPYRCRHTKAGRGPLLKCHYCFPIHQMDNTRPVHHLRTRPRSITPDTSSSPTKFLGDARATELVSHRPPQPTTAAGAVPQSGHLGIALHPPGHPASHAESHSTTFVLSGVAPIRLWATPYQRALGVTHKVAFRHTDAPMPAPFLRTRCTLAEAAIVMGHSRLHSIETIGPAIHHCRPHGGGEGHLLVHEQWHYGAGPASPGTTWTPGENWLSVPFPREVLK